jgi:hypothetical protein
MGVVLDNFSTAVDKTVYSQESKFVFPQQSAQENEFRRCVVRLQLLRVARVAVKYIRVSCMRQAVSS